MKQFFAVLLLMCLVPPLAKAAPQPRTLMCNFDGENETKVYKVVTLPGVGTTFRLHEGWKITDFVVTDPKGIPRRIQWHDRYCHPARSEQEHFGVDLHGQGQTLRV